jgi:hypothetical protein
MGHKNLTMTVRYIHLAPEHLRVAVATLDDVLPPMAQGGLKEVSEAVSVS